MVQIYNGILLNHKKNAIMPFAAIWVGPETVSLCKPDRERKIHNSYVGS